jgi:branched-chain amino acid transport system substrate-binding protein
MSPRPMRWKLFAAVSALALVAMACGGGDDGGGDTSAGGGGGGGAETVTIAFMGALTGDSANLGINIRDGVKLAVDEANAAGEGPTIALKEFDTAGDPAQAGTVKDQVIADQDVIGVVGPAFSGETKAVIPAFEDAGLVMISPSATNKDLPNIVPDGRVFHRVIADDALQASGIATYLADTVQPESVAYVHDNTEYGKGLTDDVAALSGQQGVRPATPAPLTLDPEAQDFSSTVNAVVSSGADVVFYGGYYSEAGRFKKQLTDAGFTGTFLSGDGSLDPGFVDAAGPQFAEGAQLTCPCNLAFATSESEKLRSFFEQHTAELGKDPGLYSPEGYDAANILIEGIKAGNTDRESLLSWLENDFSSYEGVSKTVEFAENGNVTSRDFFVFQVKDGKLAPLETVNVA